MIESPITAAEIRITIGRYSEQALFISIVVAGLVNLWLKGVLRSRYFSSFHSRILTS